MPANDARRTPRTRPRYENVYFPLLVLLAGSVASCTTEDVDWAADAGTGGAAPGEGGKAAGGSATSDGLPPMCPKPAPPSLCTTGLTLPTGVISDFNAPVGGVPPVFGLFGAPVWGGVYAYPGGEPDACSDAALPPYPLVSEMKDNHWRISGTLGAYSGFGVWWNCNVGVSSYPVCLLDVSAFSAIQFKIQGNPGPSGKLVLQFRTADDTPASMDPADVSCGRCTGTCVFPSKTVDVSSTPTTITVPWSELTGGMPQPFDPQQVAGIEWQFSFPGSGTFPIDVVVDDIQMLP
jgi:hypothetical protein